MDELRELMRNLGESFDQLSADLDRMSQKMFDIERAEESEPEEKEDETWKEGQTWKEAIAGVREIERGECSKSVSDAVVPEDVGEDEEWTDRDVHRYNELFSNAEHVRIRPAFNASIFNPEEYTVQRKLEALPMTGYNDIEIVKWAPVATFKADEVEEMVRCAYRIHTRATHDKRVKEIDSIEGLQQYLADYGDLVQVNHVGENASVHRFDMAPYDIGNGDQAFYTAFNKNLNVKEIIEFALKIHDQEKEKQYEF